MPKVVKVLHVLVVLWLAWVGGGMWLGKNSTPSESNLGGWVTAGAFVLAVVGVRFIYGKEFYKGPLKATLLGTFMVWFASATMTPVLQSARPAPQGNCLSNIKQLATATHVYIADTNDVFPLAENWHHALAPYAKMKFRCNEAKTKYSYGMNTAIGGVSAMSIASPERTVLLFEMDSDVPNAHGGAKDAVERHPGLFIVAFADGHATGNRDAPRQWRP